MKHNIIMPDLGQTADEGKVVRWLKKPGDKISKGDVLLEVETDKVTMDVEAYKAGYLRSLLVEEGRMASAFSPIAILTDEADEPLDSNDTGGGAKPVSASDHHTSAAPAAGEPALVAQKATDKSFGRVAASPAAKARAVELGLDLGKVRGSGPDGLITRRDLVKLPSAKQSSWPALPMAEIATRSMQTIPHFYMKVDVEMSTALRWRKQWNRLHPELHASLNDVFVRVASQALEETPSLNVRFREGRVEALGQADILMVVAADPGLLLVPVANPSSRGWEDYLREMRRLLEEARRKRGKESVLSLSPALAISNLGMHGVKEFTAIIPPGSAAVMSIGSVRETIIVKDLKMRMAEVCSLTLALDHRVADGVTGAIFLERMQAHLNSL